MIPFGLAFALAAALAPAALGLLRRLPGATGRRILVATSAVHLTNDACFSLLYPLLPFIAADLGLSYAEVGLLKAVFSFASSVFQLPTGILAERLGEYTLLLAGNLWVGLGLGVMALAGSYSLLVAASLLAGIGGNAQHPLAPALVSRAYEPAAVAHGTARVARQATALGTLNFAGDLGKLFGPFVVGLLVPTFGWQAALAVFGGFTAAFSAGLLLDRRTVTVDIEPVGKPDVSRRAADNTTAAGPAAPERGLGARPGFGTVLLMGGLDSATRAAALTFLPFWFAAGGFDAPAISLLLGVILAAGAAGKFLCGWLSDRFGLPATIVATELTTALTLVTFLVAPPVAVVPVALLFGFALNGTSSALTAAIALFVPGERRARAYGAYFTASLVTSSLAPLLYGVLADQAGLPIVFVLLAATTAAIAPLVVPIRGALAHAR